MNTDSTHESQMARYKAVDAAPEHKQHTIFAHRVDTWKDIETGGYIAMVPERLTYAKTEEGALKAATSMILCMSGFVAAAVAPVSAEPDPIVALDVPLINRDKQELVDIIGRYKEELRWYVDQRNSLIKRCEPTAPTDARKIAELERVIERDRSIIADNTSRLRKVIANREWLGEGRGPYEWDDDRWHEEFKATASEIREALKPFVKMAADLTNSPKTWDEVQKARQSQDSEAASLRERVATLEKQYRDNHLMHVKLELRGEIATLRKALGRNENEAK